MVDSLIDKAMHAGSKKWLCLDDSLASHIGLAFR